MTKQQLTLFDPVAAADQLARSPDLIGILSDITRTTKQNTLKLRQLLRDLGTDPDDVPPPKLKRGQRAAQPVISDVVRAVLTNCEVSATTLRLPPEQLERDLYEQVKKVIVGVGGKWNGPANEFRFARDPRQQLGLTLDAGKLVSTKKQTQAFYTPTDLVARVLAYAPPLTGLRVLEPSAGEGAFAEALRAGGAQVQCAEFDADSAAVLRGKQFDVWEGDFLAQPAAPDFDLVVMNPPFAKQQDIKHVEHALRFLHPGGQLLAIISPSFTFASTAVAKRFRQAVERQGCILENIETNAFKHSGTSVPTVLVRLSVAA